MSLKDATYQCTTCNEMRTLNFVVEDHQAKTSKSANGLAMYSDIHRCQGGFLGINNLRVDHNFHIRSFEFLKLPEYRKPSISIPGLPMARATKAEEIKEIIITQLWRDPEIKLTIHDGGLNVILNFGNVNLQHDVAISEMDSDMGMLKLKFYPSDMIYNTHIEKWLSIFVNQIEVLPPSQIGLYVETLRYIQDNSKTRPEPFNIKVLKTMLASHEIYFDKKGDIDPKIARERISAKYGDATGDFVNEILTFLQDNPGVPLQEYTRLHNKELVYLIHLFIILEQEEVLNIDRPGIIQG